MSEENRELVGRLLLHLRDGLAPVVEQVLAPHTPPGRSWTFLLEERERTNGRTARYATTDLQSMLVAMTGRIGALGYPFTPLLSTRSTSALPSELRAVRNEFAHMADFDDDDTDRALDSGARLLRALESPQAEPVEALLDGFRRQRYATAASAPHAAPAAAAAPTADGMPTVRVTLPVAAQASSSLSASTPAPAPIVQSGRAATETSAPAASPSDAHPSAALSPAPTAAPAPAPVVTIRAETLTTLSYAMAHNAISPASSIELTSTEDVRGALLEVALRQDSGPIGAPQQYHVDLVHDRPTLVPVRRFVLDGSAMLALDSPRPGRFDLTVRDGDRVLGAVQADVDLLAAQQWRAAPLQLGLEMLPAHVTPHHPLLRGLLVEAAEILRERTGSASLNAYQDTEERVDAIVLAICTAMQGRNVRYANPPASWGDGQIVRTVDEVLDGGLGTCLDTSVVLAAALEQAGVDAILLVYRTHANVGYWRSRELRYPDEVLTDANAVVNLIDTERIGAVETTLLTAPEPLDLDEQRQRIVAGRLRGEDVDDFEGAVDLAVARRVPVLPLPVRTTAPEGGTLVTEYAAVAPALPAREVLEGRAAPAVQRDEPERVTRWKGALLDLSLRNRLLNFPDSARLQLLLPDGAAAEVENLLHAGRSITLIPSDRLNEVDRLRGDVRSAAQLDAGALLTRLRTDRTAHVGVGSVAYPGTMLRLANNARTIAEETGANNLYLAVGSLLWQVKGKRVRSPLILIPVTLKARTRGSGYSLALDEAGASTPNFCLIEKLRQELGLSIPALEQPAEDESGIDIDATLRAVREVLIDMGLPFQVEASLDVAILQFAKYRLWKDLDDHWEEFAKNPLVGHLLHTPDVPFAQPEVRAGDLDALAARTPIPADASQLDAVAEAIAGRTFVLEGPPGTGKSQTITNLLARAIAEGKRVLFVAEKRAALEVVQRRLESVGLAPFALDLHDKASRLNELRRQLRESLDAAVAVDRNALDAANATVRRTTASLARYAEGVHERNGLGLSLYDARQQQLSLARPSATLTLGPDDVRALSEQDARGLTQVLEAALDTTPPARPHPRHGWAFVDDEAARRVDPARLAAAATRLDEAIGAFERTPAVLQAVLALTDLADLRSAVRALEVPNPFAMVEVERAADPTWRRSVEEAVARLRAFAAADHGVLRDLDRSGLDLPLEQLQQDAGAAAASGFFGRKKRLKAVAARFGPALGGKAEVPSVLKQLPELAAAAIAVRDQRDAARDGVLAIPGLAPDAGDPFDPGWAERSDARRLALIDVADRWQAVAASSPFRPLVGDALRARTAPAGLADALAELLAAIEDVAVQAGPAVDGWLGGDGWPAAWTATAADRVGASSLHRWLEHLRGLRPLLDVRAPGVLALHDALADGAFPVEAAAEAFELALADAAVQERTIANRLDDFDPVAQDDAILRYRRALGEVQRILSDALPADLISTRRFDAASSSGQVGRLRRELERQRGGLKIRPLLEQFHDLILSITPCVLVSPESVARFFPARQDLFDLVVFDEASQVRVADAIGAMGRGTSVVVVGDSRQMPPSTFAMSGGGVDDETGLTASGDEESILTECVRAQVPASRLTWHYRSRHESLIAFSNEHYYDSRLASFPSPRTGDDRSVIEFVRVDGEFLRTAAGKDKRTNPIEARAIVDEVERRFAATPDEVPSVGIVTFNKEQRDLVESLLRQSPDDRIGEALDQEVDGLFVKNLENVQGDERDAILFSIAFSKNAKRDLPLNFGPLTQSGGERRLNVAVTRARAEVVLFCSFDPSELRAEETQSVGVKHLRDYLRLAQQGRPEALAMRRRPRADAHRDDLAAALERRGLAVRTDVGLSDFRVDLAVAAGSAPDTDLIAILLDTPEWRARRTVHDRDVLPVAVLGGSMGWPRIVRVWLPDWLADRDVVLARIDAEVALAGEQRVETPDSPPVERPQPQRASAPPTAPRQAPHETRAPRYVPWRRIGSGSVEVLNDLPLPAAGRRVSQVLTAIVAHEGPVHFARLAKLGAAEFGLSRVTGDRAAAILRQLDPSHVRDGDATHAWPGDVDRTTWTGYRWSSPDDDRDLRSISPVELANLMRDVAEQSAGIEEEPLFREVLARVGARRLTPDVQAHLALALEAALELGRLRRAGEVLLPE